MERKEKNIFKILENDLQFLLKNKVKLILFRNYFDELSTHDIDILCKKSDEDRIISLLNTKGYRVFKKFSHKIYCHNLKTNSQFVFHIHFNAYETPFTSFLNINQTLKKASKVKGIPVLSPSQIVALYLYKIKTKRPFVKAKKHILSNFDSINYNDLGKTLENTFYKDSIKLSLKYLKNNKFNLAGNSLKFKNPIFPLVKKSFYIFHLLESIFKSLPASDFVVFIGTDGSGKTTTTTNFANYFKKKGLNVEYEYGGRFQFRYLPLNWLVSRTANIKKKQGEKPDTIKYNSNFVYFATPLVYYFEYLLRYLFSTFIKRRKNHFVFADRSYIDVITSANASQKFAKFLYKYFLPKPSKVFFLYNEAHILSSRRPEHDPEDIKRQLKGFHKHGELYTSKIKTTSIEDTFDKILEKLN